MHFTECSPPVMYVFQLEATLYICRNVKEILAQNRRDIYSLSDCNETQTLDQLVPKWILSHVAKVTKWLNWVVNFFLYGAFDRIFLSCLVHASQATHTSSLPECQRSPCSKQALYPKFKWLQRNSNPQRLYLETNTQSFGQTDQIIWLRSE